MRVRFHKLYIHLSKLNADVVDSFFSPRRVDVKVILDNGLLQVTLSNPEGIISGIKYAGIDNLLEVLNDESNRG